MLDGAGRRGNDTERMRNGKFWFFSYGFNGWGVRDFPVVGVEPMLGLGGHALIPGREQNMRRKRHHGEQLDARVVMPSDMIVIADTTMDGGQDQWVTPQRSASSSHPGARHADGAQVFFADGHVSIFKKNDLIKQTAEAMRRWNNDYDPHEEFWE